jgi:homeodomain-containing protein
VLVQPATVARWHREGFRGCWSRRLQRRPGRPCIDSQLRALIRRMATENRLWGAPRIHGELLKLGITVSERTVSRYLPDRLTGSAQTWRTFLTNHLGNLAFTSTATSSYAPGDDDIVDARVFPFRPAPTSRDRPCVSHQWAVVDRPSSLQRTTLGWRVAQAHFHHRIRAGPSSGNDPPKSWAPQLTPKRTGRGRCGPETPSGPAPTNNLRPFARRLLDRRGRFLSLDLFNQASMSSEGRNAFAPAAKRTSATDSHVGRNIGETHPIRDTPAQRPSRGSRRSPRSSIVLVAHERFQGNL